jgi:putative hydrolase of HD superfamily
MKEQNVINYYVLCNKLKNVIRTGWKDWHVQRDRIESVAEHVYGTQMLALAMKSEFEYDIDIVKVIYMLAIHEIGETVIGDLTAFQIEKHEKVKIEHEAVHKILGSLIDGEKIEKLFLEFDEHKTEESKFAYQCDKLECDLQCKLYDLEGCVDLTKQESSNARENEQVQELLREGKTWSDMWLQYDLDHIEYDENFRRVAMYAMKNDINML